MKFDKDKIEALCASLFQTHLALAERSRLNGASASDILGVSRSRYSQLLKDPEATPMLQTHIFLNLMWSNKALEQGLDEGWLPASGFKGAGQAKAIAQLKELAT